jgi:hypothetical protein
MISTLELGARESHLKTLPVLQPPRKDFNILDLVAHVLQVCLRKCIACKTVDYKVPRINDKFSTDDL